jgi:nitrate/TMAO reductase-like tetraheme cytochrome c subunit
MANRRSASRLARLLVRATLPGAALAAAAALLALSGPAAGIVNPHDTAKPKFCLNCHTEAIYTKSCDGNEGYCLLAGSVDALCLICHLKEECCKPGLEHLTKLHLGMRSHPSDVAARDIPPETFPSTLPLHRGRITCRTCHLHTQQNPGGYKMLRLVKITGQSVDWTALCRDCHKNR